MTVVAAVHTLTSWGILRPSDTIATAVEANIPLDLACAMLEQESGGGRNVFGSDGVATGGAYVKGSEVTRESYLKYRAIRAQYGAQGVGPMQLTYPPLQDQADAAGGCWDPRVNMLVGFQHLASLIRANGLTEGVRKYNGSGPAAENYKIQVLAKKAKWNTRIGNTLIEAIATTPFTATPSPVVPALEPTSAAEDEPVMNIPINVAEDGSFRGGVVAEEGSSSAYVAEATLVFGVMWGSADVYIQFLGADGLGMGPDSGYRGRVGQNGTVALNAPNGCKLVSVEGQLFGQGVVPTAVLFMRPK